MAHRTSVDGPYFTSGSISFSQLASTFGGSSSNIRASDYIRNTNVNESEPRVPDATENGAIASSQSNWRLSQFRNSVKTYYVEQYSEQVSSSTSDSDVNTLTRDGTGTTTDGSNGGRRWNGNLNKNIKKFYTLNGTCGSSVQAAPALRAQGTVYNLRITINGSILGYGGPGGASVNPNGTPGGNALEMSTSGSRIPITIGGGGRIYGGGGGGEKGANGAPGNPGTCTDTITTENCGGCPGCPPGYSEGNCWSGGGCDRRQVCNWWGNCWWTTSKWTSRRNCTRTYQVAGGLGGAGGAGGTGRGYNNQSGSLSGNAGFPGAPGNGCGSTPGAQGGTGAPGGDWGANGGNTPNTGNGGTAGRAITGGNYSLNGSVNSSTLKGFY